MKLTKDFRNSELSQALVEYIKRLSTKEIKLMEFCGSHTMAIFKYGIRQLMPPTIKMLSGPGCPVCVTDTADIDRAVAMARLSGIILCTFGDMLKVPGTSSSLQQAKADNCDVRVVYSTIDALDIAKINPGKEVIFLGVGFETTAPTIAASVLQAKAEGIDNYSVFSLAKICPPVMKALLDAGEVTIDGIICPGHVSVIIGSKPYEFIPRDYGIGCVISGFEPLDILQSINMLVSQIENGKPKVEIAYLRGVSSDGNTKALELMEQVFNVSAASWRGIGKVAASGLKLSDNYKQYDAELNFPVETGVIKEPEGCLCGQVLRGTKKPTDCSLFRRICTPEQPVGPCMVSYEGACSNCFLYESDEIG
ncbi:MAG: hydrogenase formation protein HypD [Dehalococcoidia bacterium]|nr:MAG: hydrogenase formation protein HypD [Dehalococcoidia bacterium]